MERERQGVRTFGMEGEAYSESGLNARVLT